MKSEMLKISLLSDGENTCSIYAQEIYVYLCLAKVTNSCLRIVQTSYHTALSYSMQGKRTYGIDMLSFENKCGV